jgi:ribosome-binding factor A
MKFKRSDRVAEQMQREISQMLLQEVKDPRIGFVTVTEVRCSDDLRNARAFVSVFGEPKDKQRTMEGLASVAGFVQHELMKRLRLRCAPEILFTLDETAEKAAKIEQAIKAAREADLDKAKQFNPAPEGKGA